MNLKQLQYFLGLNNGYRKYIESYAHKTEPLHDLVATHTKLETVKQRSRKIILDWYSHKQKRLSTNCEHYSQISLFCFCLSLTNHSCWKLTPATMPYVGAIFLQNDPEGKHRSIAYFSKSLTKINKKIFNVRERAISNCSSSGTLPSLPII